MDELQKQQIREITRNELQEFLASDRYIFSKLVQFLNGRNIQVGVADGTKIGTGTDQKIGFFNTTPAVQPSSTGETNGFTAGGGGSVLVDSTFTGNSGSTAYTVSDLVKHLKALGIIKS